jgi:hypothetical protein
MSFPVFFPAGNRAFLGGDLEEAKKRKKQVEGNCRMVASIVGLATRNFFLGPDCTRKKRRPPSVP